MVREWGAMFRLLSALAAAAETPAPEFDPTRVTPGPVGFIAIALVAITVILLLLDMNRRLRRLRYRAEIGERLDAEQAARSDAGSGDVPADGSAGSSA